MDQEGLKKGQEGLKLAVLDKKKACQLDGALFIKCLPKVAQRPPVCNKKKLRPRARRWCKQSNNLRRNSPTTPHWSHTKQV